MAAGDVGQWDTHPTLGATVFLLLQPAHSVARLSQLDTGRGKPP
eukprot:CAMPEP_0118970108 /NCGR_PEP_ID=MMETSP1173-20130426/7075_1 /TAXON_ID=1034831 /ORGANISM="Rhizochromulina marina cf, Strain CCMP1243" /LENGTH=43 /DNA_ID= /DNA_START= /DNA_END= /DNA_ORIENTATION=